MKEKYMKATAQIAHLVFADTQANPEKPKELFFRHRTDRKRNRKSNFKGPLQITVVLRGDWYYVSMDNYPYKTIEAYRYHAVRVHVMTGEVEEPE